MKRAILPLLLAASTALAQAPSRPVESVTVTGTRSRQVIDQFVQSFTTPTRLVGKMARWGDGICPRTLGLAPSFNSFISRRVRDVAAQVGAPVNGRAGCKPNIEIVFSAQPQALLDDMLKRNPAALGYHDTSAQEQAAARMTRPIQAYYLTQTVDLRGKVDLDVARGAGPGFMINLGPAKPPLWVPNARVEDVTGTRLGDGLRSEFNHVLIVADPARLAEHEMGALADYVSLLALAQIAGLDTCQTLPSMVNLLAADCDRKPAALTDSDMAYLRGLYRMGADKSLGTQQNDIAFQMQQSLR